MLRWIRVVFILGALLLPVSARAQSAVSLGSVHVQLWPEYDQPSMLVIYDFQVGAGVQLPIGLAINFPKDANLIAVAVEAADGSLLNADYAEGIGDERWQSVIIQIQSPSVHRIEYYQPLTRSADLRQFSYEWAGGYAVQDFGISVRVPGDASGVSSVPALQNSQTAGGPQSLEGRFGALAADDGFTLRLEYTRSSESLEVPQQDLRPSQPLDASTPGRVVLSNYLPYILGVLGLVLIGGGSLYFWQSGRGRPSRKKRHGAPRAQAHPAGDVHCHQCGTRAEPGDRFCRVCGTRLRIPE